MYDVAIIGAGVIGASIFRELTKYKVNVILVEKENDVCMGCSKANSAIIHAGFDPKPGTLMAKYNVRGNELIEGICNELNVPFKRIGAFVTAFTNNEVNVLKELLLQGKVNGVKNLKIIDKEQLHAIEPNVSKDIIAALYAPSSGIIGPFEYTIALVENAICNGGSLKLNCKVEKIEKKEHFIITDSNGFNIKAKYVINASGVYGDDIHNMICKEEFKIKPRKGEYYVLDKEQGNIVNRTIFPCPTKVGKGILITPTVHGNLLVGPNAIDILDKEEISTSYESLNIIKKTSLKTVSNINFKNSIRNFSGLRAISNINDFIIKEDSSIAGFIDVVGIKSPGLSSAPAIAEAVIEILNNSGLEIIKNQSFNPIRSVIQFNNLSTNEKNKLIKENPKYGRIICRCENISQGEIIDAINRSFESISVDGIKRRCRPGMGRCQGGFCGPKVLGIISDELGIDKEKINLDKNGSYIVLRKTKKEEKENV